MAADLSQFIDIHVHILPGIDDGPKSLAESLAMAKAYVDVGVTRLIATPHFIPGTAWAAGRQRISSTIQELNKYLIEKDITLKIFPGMEIAYHQKMMDRFDKGVFQPLGQSNTYLLEPSFNDSSVDLLRCAREIMASGCGVIIAHPERIPSFQEIADPLVDLVGQGLQVQITIGSFLDKFGESSKKLAMHLIDKHSVHFLASDAHSNTGRCPPNHDDWEKLIGILGDDLLTQLCITNPDSLISNK